MRVAEWHRAWPRYAKRLGSRRPDTIRKTHARAAGFAAAFGDRRIQTLKLDELTRWALGNVGNVRYVKTVLNDAVAAGVADDNPMLRVAVKAPEPGAYHVPSEQEVRAVAELMGDLRKFVLLSAFSGLRVSEVCDLEGRDVLEGRLRVRDGKGGKSRTVVLFCPEAVPEGVEAGYLFSRRRVRRVGWQETVTWVPWTQQSVHKRWVPARAAAGLPDNCRFHDLRRFHATWLLDRGASDLDVATQLGHFDARGVPDAELIRRVYGRPSVDAALDRLQLLA